MMKWAMIWLFWLFAGCDAAPAAPVAEASIIRAAPATVAAVANETPPWWQTVAPDGTLAPLRPARTPTATSMATTVPTTEPYDQGILFRTTRERGFETIWIMDTDGSRQRKLRPAGDDFFERKTQQFYLDALDKQLRAPDGSKRVYVNPDLQLSIQLLPSGVTRPLTFFGAGLAYEPAWSLRGDQVACVSNDTSLDEIWLVPADPNLWGDDAHKHQLTHSQWESNKHPTWSPDGARIAFWSNREGHKQIYVMNHDGSGVTALSRNAFEDYDPVWIR